MTLTRRIVAALTSAVFAGLLGTAGAATASEPWTGVVTWVVDGDTLHVRPLSGGKPVSVRISGIDAPEICQAGGVASRNALRARVLGRAVRVTGRARDRYSRLVAGVAIDGHDVALWMVVQGQAWSNRSRRSAGPYGVQQAQAQAARRGLFASDASGSMLLEPSAFRKQHKSCHRV